MGQESSDASLLLQGQFVDIGAVDYGTEHAHRPPSQMILLGYRTIEDDSRLGSRDNALGMRTIVDLTTDPNKHFAASQRVDGGLAVARQYQVETLCSNGVKFCWIGLRTRAYAKRILRRISWWNHCKMMWHFATWDFDNPAVKKAIEDAMLSCDPITDCCDILDCAQNEIGQSVSQFSDATAYPLCLIGARDLKYQCLVLTVVLLAAKKPRSVVQKCIHQSLDVLSKSAILEERERAIVSDLLCTRQTWVQSIDAHLETHYQGISNYLREGGVTAEQSERLAAMLREADKEGETQYIVST